MLDVRSFPLTGGADPDDGSILPLRSFEKAVAQGLVASLNQNRNVLIRLHDRSVTATVRDEWRGQGMYVNERVTPGSISSLADIRQVPVIVAAVVALLGTAAAAHALTLTVAAVNATSPCSGRWGYDPARDQSDRAVAGGRAGAGCCSRSASPSV